MSENLYQILSSRFPADRDAPFIEVPGGPRYSYGDLENTVGHLARALRQAGLKVGDRVALQAEKSPESLFLYLATVKAGGVFLPLNTAYTAHEVAYFLGDAEPRILICDPAREAELSGLPAGDAPPRVFTLDGTGRGSLTAAAEALTPLEETAPAGEDDLAAILYTSGTTGRSKGAMLSHGNLASNALTLHRIWGFVPGDVLLHALPIYHTHGLFVASNCVLANGTSMLFMPRFDAAQAIDLLPRATVMMGVPTFYTRLLDQAAFGPEACRNMRLFISGSAPLLAETFAAFEARTGHRILERYGMTETGMNSSNPLEGERKGGTVGPPLPDVEARVADGQGNPLPAGEIGILEVKGPNVFKGYWRQPDKTAEEFRPDGYFITGDMARIDEDGYIQIVGRSKDLVISGGLNIYPKEVELVIDSLPGVLESAVIGLPHPDFGEAVTAVVVPDKDASPEPGEAAIIAAAKQQLAGFKVPKRVFFTEALPRNTMGKVQKNLLREQYAQSAT